MLQKIKLRQNMIPERKEDVGRIAVIGGGASGMMAAITAARLGTEVIVYEKNDRVGKKILVTGNGKCNFSNRDFSEKYYYGNRKKLKSCFERFSVEDTVAFFSKAGMLVKEKNGYLYPWSEQAATVLDVLRMEMEQSGVRIELCADVKAIVRKKQTGRFAVRTLDGEEEYDAVILACGGCAAPKTGSDGSGFALAEILGHHITPPVPALVQLRCRDDFLRAVAGVRCQAGIRLYERKRLVQEEEGELQFTDYGISGIPVFQLSRQAAFLLKERKNVAASIDLLPQLDDGALERMCADRMKSADGKTLEGFLLGIANKKVNLMIIKEAGYKPGDGAMGLGAEALKNLLFSYKKLWVHITAVNSFDHAQVTAGGVVLDDVSENLESLKIPGMYLAGEILDVDGRCGGYNLQWAWTSGYIAGKSAARRVSGCR